MLNVANAMESVLGFGWLAWLRRAVRLDDGQAVNQRLNVIDAEKFGNHWQPGPVDAAVAVAQHVPGVDRQPLVVGRDWLVFTLVDDAFLNV
jgi:hypothetical protein